MSLAVSSSRHIILRLNYLLNIFLLQVVEVLNPLAREFKSIGTMKKELAGLQEELAVAHKQVFLILKSEELNSDLILETLISFPIAPKA